MRTFRILLLSCLIFSGMTLMAQNRKMHLLEHSTSTGCGECPCVDSMMYHCIIPSDPHNIVIQYHSFVSMDISCPEADTLVHWEFIDGTQLRVDRNGIYYNWTDWFKNLHQLCDSAMLYIRNDTVAPVKMVMKNKAYDVATRTLSFSVDFTPYGSGRNDTVMFNASITEDKLVRSQQHWDTCGTPLGRGGMYPANHNDVIRNLVYQPYGSQLIAGSWPITQTITKNFSIVLADGWIPSNCNVVVYAYKKTQSMTSSLILQALKQSVAWPLGEGNLPTKGNLEIKIIPNPARERVNAHLSVPEAGTAHFSITDMSGKTVRDLGYSRLGTDLYNLEFSLGSVPSGQYLLCVTLNGKTYTEKFSVVK